jgi:Ca2+-transporting ATPase
MEMLKDPYAKSVKDVITHLGSDANSGLTSAEAEKRLKTFGENTLKRKKPKSIWKIFLEQLLDPIIYILAGAMGLAFLFNEWVEGFAILIVIVITALIGFFMEWQALRSIEALQKIAETVAYVLRDGRSKDLKSHFLVPGDIILIEAGDVIPADARLIENEDLALKEAMLTGESNQVEKNLEKLPSETSLVEQNNMVFKGTIVERGTAKAVVTATGDKTNIGQISTMVQEAKKKGTPLEKKLNKLSQKLIWLTIILAVIIAMSGYFQGKDMLLMIETGIALAVAAIPEGLPIVATIALARGMVRLSRKKVIIKKLEAVQTLGETGIICTDKTGTLTENKMAVHKLLFHDKEFNLKDLDNRDSFKNDEVFARIVEVGVLCNNIEPDAEKKTGDAMEIALIDFAEKVGFNFKEIRDQYSEVLELPFDAERKIMATLNKNKDKYIIFVKGAFESVIESSDSILTEEGIKPLKEREKWQELSDKIASEGLRVLAFAYRESDSEPDKDNLVQQLVFIGIMGFLDPPREDVKEAIQTYKNAGIRVIMITGDHPGTARKIGEEIGLLEPNSPSESVIKGNELTDMENLSEEEDEKILKATIFARMIPKQKLDLIDFYQAHNAIVGMLGDGVNDAPALKKADIGIAMGIRGTEAAKEVADVILMDDKFTSTELAIRQGRNIFGNIRQFVIYLLSCNLAEIIAVAGASISNLPLPLLPLQILFLNLVTDVFPALALGMGKGEKDIMKEQPRSPDEPIITKKNWTSILVYGLCITAAVIGITFYASSILKFPPNVVNNMAFYTLVLAQLLNVFNLPKRNRSFFKNEVTANSYIWGAIALSLLIMVVAYYVPILKEALSLESLTAAQFITVGMFGLSALLLTQIIKRLGGIN